MKLEIEVPDCFLTKKHMEELENYFVKKLIGIKAGISQITLPDTFAHLVFIAAKKRATEKKV